MPPLLISTKLTLLPGPRRLWMTRSLQIMKRLLHPLTHRGDLWSFWPRVWISRPMMKIWCFHLLT